MMLSLDDKDPLVGITDLLSFLDVCMNGYGLGRDQHSCAVPTHSMIKNRATRSVGSAPTSSSTRLRAYEAVTFRHTSCSTSCLMTERAADQRADPLQFSPILPRGFSFVLDEAVPSVIEATSLESFSRMEARSEFSEFDCFERIVRQPSRRDSQCVPT